MFMPHSSSTSRYLCDNPSGLTQCCRPLRTARFSLTLRASQDRTLNLAPSSSRSHTCPVAISLISAPLPLLLVGICVLQPTNQPAPTHQPTGSNPPTNRLKQ